MPDLKRQDQVKQEALGTRGFTPRHCPHPGNRGQIGRNCLPGEKLQPWDAVTKHRTCPCHLSRSFPAQVSTCRLNFQTCVPTLLLQDFCSAAAGSRYLPLWLRGLREQSLIRAGGRILRSSDSPSYAVGTIPSTLKTIASFLKSERAIGSEN